MVIGRAMAFLGGRKATMAMRCWETLGLGYGYGMQLLGSGLQRREPL